MNHMKALCSNAKRRMTTAFFIMLCLCLALFVEGALAELPGDSRAPADREAELDMSRYSDVTAGFRTGRDVTTGAVFPLADKLRVPARGAYVLDLQK